MSEKITDALVTEHTVFCMVFDQVERVLPSLTTLAEVKLLANLVEGLLQRHRDIEQNLAFVALDHVLEEQGHLDQLNQDHQEIDARLKRVQIASGLEQARRLLKATSRQHFSEEERHVFPLIEKVLSPHTLTELAKPRRDRDAVLVS